MTSAIITLLSDYGLEDGFVAACHGVIIGIAPQARIIDVGHLVPDGDVRRGAAILAQTVPYLPSGVHVAVVDPAVGSTRHAVAVQAGDRVFIGPDNGLLSWAVHAVGGAQAAYEITNEDLFLKPVSPTFHGRDIFAPVAAHLVNGASPADLGPLIDIGRLVTLPTPSSRLRDDAAEGEVLSVDHHGNVQLSITGADLSSLGAHIGDTLAIWLGVRQLSVPYRETFAAVSPGELVAYVDSAGLVAMAVNAGDAFQRLSLPPGAHVRIGLSR
ncbi:SAM-dependent chlorinase/fluorinase [Streptosporangiaceae bacterium NEAU-GS5]|nr:SAM-dependent chlorinase/fluorinase [Streptosporangiaceae bacterium NEAU-GS5]